MSAMGAHLQEAVERAKILASRMATISPGIKRSSALICNSDNANNAITDTENVKRTRSSDDDLSSKSSSGTSSTASPPSTNITTNLKRVDICAVKDSNEVLRNRKVNIVLGPENKILADSSADKHNNKKQPSIVGVADSNSPIDKLAPSQLNGERRLAIPSDSSSGSQQTSSLASPIPGDTTQLLNFQCSSDNVAEQSGATKTETNNTGSYTPVGITTSEPIQQQLTDNKEPNNVQDQAKGQYLVQQQATTTTTTITSSHEQQINSLNHTLFNHSILPQSDLLIPQQFVGLVIGKGGENIRRVQNETGATLYIDSSKMADTEGNKLCTITGSVDSVQRASALVQEIIESAKTGRQTLRRKVNDGELEYRMKIPAAKTGVIIGRGGDTIRAIRSQSQCSIELDKDAVDCGPEEKVFVIMGPSDRVQQAQELINARLASCLQARPNSFQTRQQPICSPNMSSQSSAALQYGNNLYSAYWQQHMAAQSAQHDPSAAWAAYYAQYYASQMQTASYGLIQEKNKSPDDGGQQASSRDESSSTQDNSSEVLIQWAQYYRAHGMVKEAEWFEQQSSLKMPNQQVRDTHE